MNVFTLTNCVVSKGYEDNPAIRFNNNENGSSAFFRVGEKVYDKRAPDNHRWNNWNVKAFGNVVERIQKMKLDAGSYITITGRMDMDTWDDNGTKKSSPVVILTDVEYSYSGNGKSGTNGGNTKADDPPASSGAPAAQQNDSTAAEQTEMPDNFTGYEGFGGPNPFYPQG